jgi:hypothetical protein
MRIKGEDLLSNPDLYLSQIAEWLNISTSPEAIASMKHPENSPYAYVGPFPCPGGNDAKFMRNPILRQGIVKEPCLRDFLDAKQWDEEEIKSFASSSAQFNHKLLQLSNLLGYN